MLSRLVYYSTNLLSGPGLKREGQLTGILQSARFNNAALSITGALLFDRRYFAQVLEGERSQVSQLFQRICQDDRHRNVTIVDAQAIQQRRFGSWSMALVRTSELSKAFDPAEHNCERLIELFCVLLGKQADAVDVEVSVSEVADRAPPGR